MKKLLLSLFSLTFIHGAFAMTLTSRNINCTEVKQKSLHSGVTLGNFVCSYNNDQLAQELNVNILTISLASKRVHLEPVWDQNKLSTLDILAKNSSQIKTTIAGINGTFFNMVTEPKYKDDICYTGMLDPTANKADAFLKVNNKILSENCRARALVNFTKDNRMEFVQRAISSNNPNSMYGIGAGPLLVKNGGIIIDVTKPEDNNPTKDSKSTGFPWILSHAPRTAIGYDTVSNTAFLVTIDGVKNTQDRTKDTGFTVPQLAEFMRHNVEAGEAMNLDGGGSTSMWTAADQKIINKPSEGTPRPIHSGLVIIEGAI